MRKMIPLDVRQAQISEICKIGDFSFVRWLDGYKNAYSRLTMSCPKRGHGDWTVTINNLVNNKSKCPVCAGRALIGQEVREEEIIRLCNDRGLVFAGWENGYKTSDSNLLVKCPTHGNWTATFHNFVRRANGCPQCEGRYTPTIEEITWRVATQAAEKGIEFLGFEDDYKTITKTRCKFGCPTHGEYTSALTDFIYSGSTCSKCSRIGHDKNKPATLYLLRSTCGQFVKIGVSNNHNRRMKALATTTPFPFELLKFHRLDDGHRISKLEQILLAVLDDAGMKGFSGAREWRLWQPSVPGWFDMALNDTLISLPEVSA